MYDSFYETEYLETKVMTAPAQQLHLMVLDAAIRYARLGMQSLAEQNLERSHEQLNRSREFVSELIGGLNPEQAPEMVHNLTQLFSFVYRNLAMADLERNPKRIEDAIRILETHRETWLELLSHLPQTTPAAERETLEWEG